MPELPEVETWRRLAEDHVLGKRIVRVHAPADATIFDQQAADTFVRRQKGRTIESVNRKGKHLWLAFDQGPSAYVHFGMTGSFSVYRETGERPRFLKAEWLLEDGTRLGYNCIRKIGKLRLYSEDDLKHFLARLGPDPLHDGIEFASFRAALEKRKAPIKSVLLDQRVVAGVGNWIADEVLYQAKVNPHTPSSRLSTSQVKALRTVLLRIIHKAVEVGADDRRFPTSWLFHHRWGKNPVAKTKEGQPIQFDTIGGRTTAWVKGSDKP